MFFQKSSAGSKPNCQEPVSYIGIENAGALDFAFQQRIRKIIFFSLSCKDFSGENYSLCTLSGQRDGFTSHIPVRQDSGFHSSLDAANHPCPVKSFQATVCLWLGLWSTHTHFHKNSFLISGSEYPGYQKNRCKWCSSHFHSPSQLCHGGVLQTLNVLRVYHW